MNKLLHTKEAELRELSKNLFYYDYLDAEEIKDIVEGRPLKKEKVRTWQEAGTYLIKI